MNRNLIIVFIATSFTLSFILYPLSFVLCPLSFVLYPLSFVLYLLPFIPLAQYSAKAAIVRLGFTPKFTGTTDPSQTYKPG